MTSGVPAINGPSRRFRSENRGFAIAFSTLRFSAGPSSSPRNLSNTAIRPPGFSIRTASFKPRSGCGMTARIRCITTASNDEPGNASCLASMMRVVTDFPARPARRSRCFSIAGVTSIAVTSTVDGRKSRSKPVPAPTISTRSPGAIRNRSIDRRRAASNPAARTRASYAGAQTVYLSRFHIIMQVLSTNANYSNIAIMLFVHNDAIYRRPKMFRALQEYDRRKAIADLIAGVTVGLVALPLALAFAISSGLTPQAGIYTAVVAGGLISLLGGSRLQIGGPTGAFVVIVAGIVADHGVEGLFVCTLMAGVMLVILGATGMGSAVKFIPRPVVVGFTNGIAVLIASTQIRDFFGLTVDTVPTEFLPRLQLLASRSWTWSPFATALAIGAIAIIVVANRVSRRIPGAIVALCVGTVVVFAFGLPVETIGTRFGGIPAGLPTIHLPHFRLELLGGLVVPAMTVALLGAIESLMSAMVADR